MELSGRHAAAPGGPKKIQKAAVRSFYTPRCTAHFEETKCEVCAHPLVNSMGKVRHTKDTNGVVTRIPGM